MYSIAQPITARLHVPYSTVTLITALQAKP
jgi:hypothetical protein